MSNQEFNLSCPIPKFNYETIQLAHGGGGTLMARLIEELIQPAFSNQMLNQMHDSVVLNLNQQKLAFTTDSFVVHPLFFPGGDIGSLAIHGTVNDLAMSGAKPLYLSCGLILEEGLSVAVLQQVLQSMSSAAQTCKVTIATGDTKVVDKGKGDGVYINTSGIGIIEHDLAITPQSVKPGDAIIISNDIARHGIAIMAVREGLEFESEITSDSAPLADVVLELIDAGIEIHCLRDATRGGVSSALNEIAQSVSFDMELDSTQIPVREDVKAACEILGFDPLYVANEGCMVAFVPAQYVDQSLNILKKFPQCQSAKMIGKVLDSTRGKVLLKSPLGTTRVLDKLSGEQLPRIC